MSTGEVERIWLPFAIWILPACAVLNQRLFAARVWIAVQISSALVFTALIRPFW